MTVALRARIDRYPAKMVGHLADRLLDRYALKCEELLDPFCGSGELLVRARDRGFAVTGYDINPYAALMARVRLEGFSAGNAYRLLCSLIRGSSRSSRRKPVTWDNKSYWFTPRTLEKYECLRHVAEQMNLGSNKDGRSVLLAYALSLRMCSRADERSPKPFISKQSRERKSGRHVDPYKVIPAIHNELSRIYSERGSGRARIITCNIVEPGFPRNAGKQCSHVITSPPYLNAQDYFRNFKLELFFLEGLIDFVTKKLSRQFIGTERGELLSRLNADDFARNREFFPRLRVMEQERKQHAAIVHRYLFDMRHAFSNIRQRLKNNGTLVVVCGDNVIGSVHVKTWKILNRIISSIGFEEFDRFSDEIRARALAPKRSWHSSLIKEERVTAFRLAL